jgi:N-acetylglutamate synthase-like GNAT family acetyltransferase
MGDTLVKPPSHGRVRTDSEVRLAGTLRIRKARLEDASPILECLAQAFAPYRVSYTPAAFADTVLTRRTLRQRFQEMTVLVAIDDTDGVIGTIAYKVEEIGRGHVRGMAVGLRWQGSGVAKSLLDRAESDLRKLRCNVMTLCTTRPLERAICFYEKNGFQATGEVSSFFGMDLLSYRKDIGRSKTDRTRPCHEE